MTFPLRILSGIPLVILAVVLIVLAAQRFGGESEARPQQTYGELLVADGRLDDALLWYKALAAKDDPKALRRLASVANLAGETGQRATAQQRLVRLGYADLSEHIEAARALAAAGARREALTILYNAERRFPDQLDMPFLWFYAALALDDGRPELALPLARRLWTKTGEDGSLKLMMRLEKGEG